MVHRLDRETSGIIIFTKTDKAFKSLKKQFLLREVEKIYHALVWGAPKPVAGKINIPIASYLGKKKISFSQKSKEAVTIYKTINTYHNKFSLIECKILTGRTHQIRVHLLSKGCPLIGDKVYFLNLCPKNFFPRQIIMHLVLPSLTRTNFESREFTYVAKLSSN